MPPPPVAPRAPAADPAHSPVSALPPVAAVPTGRTVFGVPPLPKTPAPPGLIELREFAEPASAEAPDTAPAPPVLPKLYENLPAASESARPTQTREEAARELVALVEAQLATTQDRTRLGRLHYEWARLLETPLGDFKEALVHLKKAHELSPDHEGIVAALRRVHLLLGEFEAALPWFDLEAKSAGSNDAKAGLHYEKGVLLEGPLGRAAEARKAFELAHELAPHDASILRAALRARRRDKAWKDVDRGLELQVQNASDDSLRAARLSERARLAETKRKDPKAATALFQLSFEASPEMTVALADLERLHGAARSDKDWAEALRARVRLARDPRVRSAALLLLGRVLDARLGDPARAAEALENAFQETPEELGILEDLVRLYERTENADRLLSVLSRLEERRTSDVDKVELRLRLGRVCLERSSDPESAGLQFERARALDPTHPGVVEALVGFYRERHAWDLLIQVYAGVAHHSGDAVRRAEAHRTIAEIQEHELGRKDAAVVHHQKALGLVPSYAPSFRSLARLLSELGRKTDLLELYERGVELATDDESAFAFLFKMGRLLEDELGDPARAVEIYKRILARAPTHLGALLALERAAEHAADFGTLIDAIEREAALRTGAAQVALLHRAGEVAELRQGDDAKALALYKSVLKLDPKFGPVLSSLRRLHQKAGRVQDLFEIYGKELALASTAAERAQLHFLMGQLLETRLGREEHATAEYKKALDQDPKHAPSKHALYARLTRAGQFEELAAALTREIEQEKDAALKAAGLLRLADVQENRLDKPAEALKSYEVAQKNAPESRVALEGRLRLHAALAQYKELARALDEDAEKTADPFTRVVARLRAAEVHRDDLGQLEEAAQRYELVLGDRPGHPEALLALEGLYADLGSRAALERVLVEQVRILTQPENQIAALRELLRSASVDDGERALQALLERAPTDRRALERSALRALSSGASDDLARTDARLAEGESPGLVRAAHHARLGEYLERKNAVQALLAYKNALALDAESLSAARGTSRLAETIGDAALLREAAEGEVRVTRDLARAAQLFVRAAARLREEGDIEGAATTLERALLVEPDHARAAAALLEIRLAQKEFDRVVTVLSDAATRAKNTNVRADHWIAVARVHANHRHDLAAGLTALLRVEKSEPHHAPTLLELGELYIRDRQFEPAAVRLERALAGSLEAKERTSVRLRLAELYHEHLNRPAEATTALEAVLADEPLHKDAVRRLLKLQMASGSSAARETARAWVEASEGAERADALTTWGRLARDTGELDEARVAFEQAILLVGVGAPGASADLAQLLRDHTRLGAQGGFESFAKALESFVQRAGDSPAGAAAALELGRLYLDELADPARGLPALERGLRATPRDVALRVEFTTRLRKANQFQRALEELRALLALEPARIETWRDLIEVFERLGMNGEAHLALGPLALLGGGNELQKAIWRERQPRPALVPENAFGGDGLELLGSALPGEVLALVSQLGDLGHKLYGPGWERVGIAPRDKTGARSNHPLRPIFDRVVRAFGPVDVDLYVAPDYDGPMRLVLTDPVGIVVPGNFAGLGEADQVFVLSRLVALVARGTHLAEFLGPDEFADLIIASVRLANPRFGSTRASGSELDQLSRRVTKALPWLAKGRFEDTARNYADSHPTGFVPSAESLRRAAFATALVAADDVSPLALLSRPEGSIVGLSPNEQKPTQLALLESWVSEPAMALRRRGGLA